jgi:hypothetical protein
MRLLPSGMLACAIFLAGCGRSTPPTTPESDARPSAADGALLLRRALGAIPARSARACVYLVLEPAAFALRPGETQAPQTRIAPAWLPTGRRATEQIYGCPETIGFGAPVFSRETLDGVAYDIASITVGQYCGALCGEAGHIAFVRRAGQVEWGEAEYVDDNISF